MIGLGNTLRHDDGAGVEVIRRLARRATARGIAVHEHHGEPLALLDLWEGARAAVLVDAARSGAPAGTVRRFDAGSGFSAQVEAALDSLAEAALREARRLSVVSCADAGSSTAARHA